MFNPCLSGEEPCAYYIIGTQHKVLRDHRRGVGTPQLTHKLTVVRKRVKTVGVHSVFSLSFAMP